VQFEPVFGIQDLSNTFLQLDLMPQGRVRIGHDDDAPLFGGFPRGQWFLLSVNLNITATSATARIALLGTGASGVTDVNIDSEQARNFGAVRFWIAAPYPGSFFVDNILVTRRNE
jgi:hypothetical protein